MNTGKNRGITAYCLTRSRHKNAAVLLNGVAMDVIGDGTCVSDKVMYEA